jgi:hypothetical protein
MGWNTWPLRVSFLDRMKAQARKLSRWAFRGGRRP